MTNAAVKQISFWGVVMLTVVAVDSLRNLPAAALFGDVLVGYYFLAGVFFLIPSALVSAELSARFECSGGVFTWVTEAMGPQWGLFAVWLQWIENVIWYPAILSFVVATMAYVVAPDLAENTHFLAVSIVIVFALMTYLNLKGIMSSVRFSNVCMWLGLACPMTLIIAMGIFWFIDASHIQIHLSWASFFPDLTNTDHIMSITGVGLSLCGIEVATVHAKDVKDPCKTYPKALILSAFLIVITLTMGSLAIAVVLPNDQISLVAGIMQAFEAFLKQYHLNGLLPFLAVSLVLGGLGAVNNWIIAPARGLLIAANAQTLPKILAVENKHRAPQVILIGQAVIVSLFCLVFLYFPTVNDSYWLLTVLASQLYMLMYLLLFVACMVLRLTKPEQTDRGRFVIPGGYIGCGFVCLMGIIGVVAIFLAGFVPPPNMHFGSITHYHFILGACLLLLSMPPYLLNLYKSKAD